MIYGLDYCAVIGSLTPVSLAALLAPRGEVRGGGALILPADWQGLVDYAENMNIQTRC